MNAMQRATEEQRQREVNRVNAKWYAVYENHKQERQEQWAAGHKFPEAWMQNLFSNWRADLRKTGLVLSTDPRFKQLALYLY